MKKYPYPLTVVLDRYSGVYSGGYFTAWNKYFEDVPSDIHSDDATVMDFWDSYRKNFPTVKEKDIVGFGRSAEEAIEDLIKNQKKKGCFHGF